MIEDGIEIEENTWEALMEAAKSKHSRGKRLPKSDDGN